ncbi:MAG TPA: 50S ribosomal protein L29 [Phycisphaerae bacterium]|jgi:large subunit ribosomal protein L29|nr:50S ribosomal protein L29 [Phycisphaerae bacterium]
MATETLKEFRKMATDQLKSREEELRKELFGLRTGGAAEKVKDTTKAGKLKKDIARIKTILRQQELEASRKKA